MAEVLRDNLLPVLRHMKRVSPGRRTVLPVLHDVLVRTVGGVVRFTATNLEVALTMDVGGRVERQWETTVDVRLLLDSVTQMPKGSVLTLDPLPDGGLNVKHNGSGVGISSEHKVDDFPPIPSEIGDFAARFNTVELREAMDLALVAAATEETRPVLTGVCIELENELATFAAADGYRLAVSNCLAYDVKEKRTILVPRETVKLLVALMHKTKEANIGLHVNETHQATWVSGGAFNETRVVTQLIKGTFPDWPKLIPGAGTADVTFAGGAMLAAAKQAAVIARDGNGIVRLWTDTDSTVTPRLVLGAYSEDGGVFEQAVAVMGINGKDCQVALNAKFLIDALTAVGNVECTLTIATPSSPVLFRTEHNGYRHVLMPMFVKWDDGEKHAVRPPIAPAPAPAPAPTKPSTQGRRTERRVTAAPPVVAAKETRVSKGPKDKFFRRMAAFGALGCEPDKRSWKELKPAIEKAPADAQAAFESALGKLRGQTGNAVAAVVNGGNAEPQAAVTTTPADTRPIGKRTRKSTKPIIGVVDATASIAEAMARANGRAAA